MEELLFCGCEDKLCSARNALQVLIDEVHADLWPGLLNWECVVG
jgi:hypothetical protein